MSSPRDSGDEIQDFFPSHPTDGINIEAFTLQEREHEGRRVNSEQRFNEMNKQTMELTSLVKTIAQRETSNCREGNNFLATTSISASRYNTDLLLRLSG